MGTPLPLLFIFPCMGHFKASALLALLALNFTEFSGPLLVFRMSDYIGIIVSFESRSRDDSVYELST